MGFNLTGKPANKLAKGNPTKRGDLLGRQFSAPNPAFAMIGNQDRGTRPRAIVGLGRPAMPKQLQVAVAIA
jgi:hypothetical protein